MSLSARLGSLSSAPLARHVLFSTRDLDEARARVSDVYCPHELRFAAAREHVADTCMSRLVVGGVAVNRLRYGATVRIDAGCLEEFLLVMMPLEGCAEVGCGTTRVRSTPRMATVVTPTRPLRETVEAGCDQVMIQVDRALLERTCAQHLGHALPRPVEFDLGLDMDAAGAHDWLNLVAWLVMAGEREAPLINSPLLRAQVEHMVATTLLLTQGNTFSGQLARPVVAAGPAYVRRAAEFIESHADQPLTVASIAGHAGVSTRALHAGFRAHLGVSPMEFLKAVRLARVRSELLQGGPERDNVSAVALRWGFQHLGHFAASYRRQFGETPSATRRRAN